MGSHSASTVRFTLVALTVGTLAACAPKAPPPPPPPPPPPVVVIPPRPLPPLGASSLLAVPLVGPDGLRNTVNARISSNQTEWNLRSAYNVAALNCQRPEHAEILSGYKAYLKNHKTALTKVNKAVDTEFKGRYGASYIKPREAYMTQVYNFYAFPPTLPNFCDASLAMARESLLVKSADLPAFAARQLPMLDAVFEHFFKSYDQYRADAAAWDARYAPVTPTYVPPLAVPAVSPVVTLNVVPVV